MVCVALQLSAQDPLDPAEQADSLAVEAVDSTYRYRGTFAYSKDSLDAPVQYKAVDSMIYDIANKKIHLYGAASVEYSTITLTGAHIVYDWETNIVTAEAYRDSSTRETIGIPEFTEGDQTFTAMRMRYNFKTRKGKVYEVTSQYNDVIIHGTESKFITGEKIDTTKADDIIYSQGAIFSTCTLREPHFGIRSRKQKVIPNKLVVVGPSNLEIMGVPTPLWLPFGFFPVSSGRQTGLLFPRDYEYSEQWGFGLRDIGWYFPLSDHFNLSVTSNIYLKGTWGVNIVSQYNRRYKYTGNFNLGFDSRIFEGGDGSVSRNNAFKIRWSHNQAQSAHPTIRFGGNVNFEIGGYQSRVFNDASNVLQNQLNSNVNFDKRWLDKPFTLNASFSHSQNTRTETINVNFPSVRFITQALYPFKRKERVGREKWYETITMRYSGEARNQFTGRSDSTFISRKTLDEAQMGVRHNASAGTSFKLFRYFNLNPSVNYTETWYFKSRDIGFDPTPIINIDTVYNSDRTLFNIVRDTVAFGTRDTTLNYGFNAFRQTSASLSLNTQIFGTKLFPDGKWLKGLRHVIKPSLSLVFTPDLVRDKYFRTVEDEFDPNEFDQYSIFEDAIYGQPRSTGEQFAVSYSINNIFEAKVFNKRDSTDQNIKLFDNIIVNGNYNFAADSLKWSQMNVSGTTRFFKGMTTIGLRAVFDPYIEENGRRVNRTAWREDGKIIRFVNATARFNTSITISKLRALFQGKEEPVVESVGEEPDPTVRRSRGQSPREEQDFLGLFENFRINHNLVFDWDSNPRFGREKFDVTTHSVNMSGSVALTDKWAINVGNFGYDFARRDFSYPYLGFTRDLHCWEMSMNWAPTRNTYTFSIQVKPGTLDFIKIPYQRNNADAFRRF